mgnify:CR=1 FL=1
MFDRIWPVIRKEFIQIVRDRRTLAIVLLMPPMQILLLGYAVNTDVQHIRTMVVDQARTPAARELVLAFTTTQYFDVVRYGQSPAEARRAIDSGTAKVALIIPHNFSTNLESGQTATAQILIDGSDPNSAQTALFVATAIAQSKGIQLLQESVALPLKPPLEIRPNVLYNPDLRSVNFMVPGLIGLVLQFQALILTAFAIVREREQGTLEQLIVTPLKSWELMLGKILPFVLIAFWNVGVACAAGLLWFQVEFAGSFALLLGLSLLFLLGSLGIGLLISTISQTQTQAMQTAMFILMPSFILSGLFFPLENTPPFLYVCGHLIPLTYFLRILRGIVLKGVGLEYLWVEALLLAVFSIVVFAISAIRFQKKLA